MAETRTIFDPFDGKTVEIRNDLVFRLRGKYAVGPTLPNGEPEFGWRELPVPPIQKEAADTIDRLNDEVKQLGIADCLHQENQAEQRETIERLRKALTSAPCPSGGYTDQPKDEYANVEACLKAGVCGCDLGAALS